MILELISVGMLGAVVFTKYGTTAQITKLKQTELAMKNELRSLEQKYKALSARRVEVEQEEASLTRQMHALEIEFERIMQQVAEQDEINKDLEERILQAS
jgi:septal ring factor EnvC (AmiA/AmiB activator)